METENDFVEEKTTSNGNQMSSEFKKPVLVGRIGKLPRKVEKTVSDHTVSPNEDKAENIFAENPNNDLSQSESNLELKKKLKEHLSPAELLKDQLPIPYKEPKWSGLPPAGSGYRFEVLKSGSIIDTIDLMDKPFYVFGRLAGCDVIMAHPTISRYHAVLQYKARDAENSQPNGFYVYDLGSSHGTVVNKTPVKPKHYVRLRVGHLIKLGCSTRHYILQGPDDDMEEESELSLTEMKELRKAKKEQFEKEMMLAKLQKEKEEEERQKKIEQEGISWGMSEDAEEETDLSENPYAQSTNEELYLDDPKKTLRGFFEREGCTLEYDCQERGIGQFVCRVELPIEDARGNSVIAEVIHKGKKKDAVVQCALEACRIIDRHGLLRQAKHESRKRKTKNWKDDDYYDSDDDTFLDRTGLVEKKREKRMKEFEKESGSSSHSNSSYQTGKALTYNELVDNCQKLKKQLEEYEKKLSSLREQGKSKIDESSNDDTDALDQFMLNLGKQTISNKTEISKTKMDIQKVKTELEKMEKLCEIAKPAILPPLISKVDQPLKNTIVKKSGNSIFIAKKITKSVKKDVKHPTFNNTEDTNFTEEMDSDEETDDNATKTEVSEKSPDNSNKTNVSIKSDNKKKMNTKSIPVIDTKKVFGPMRPPSNYTVPDGYYDQENDRDLPEITENEENL